MAQVLQHQIIAVVKDLKDRFKKKITDAHHSMQRVDALNGLSRTFKPIRETEGEATNLPPAELKRVTTTASSIIASIEGDMIKAFDAVATQDEGNMFARGDVIVRDDSGAVTFEVKNVPATHLLFLEKQMIDVCTFVDALPVLDPSEAWSKDQATGTWRSDVAKSRRTKKINKPIVLYNHSAEHPAQTQLVVEDVDFCDIETVKLSGCLSATEKLAIQSRARALLMAIKEARQSANSVKVEQAKEGSKVFKFIFGS